MANLGSQRYLNDMLIRLMTLRKCIREFDNSQVDLDIYYQVQARESLIGEYQRTAKLVRAELDAIETIHDPQPAQENTPS